jgi:predicted amidohydrolase
MSEQLSIESYSAIAMQLKCRGINQHKDVDSARAAVMANVTKAAEQIVGGARFNSFFTGAETKLVVLPEFVLTGFPLGETIAEWRERAAVEPDGPEFDV